MDVEQPKTHKWHGSAEKKWDWYKYTKPCFNMIHNKSCHNPNCNYAHTLDQYVDAILKRNFKLDFNIVNQLKLVEISSNIIMTDDVEMSSTSRKRRLSDSDEEQMIKKTKY